MEQGQHLRETVEALYDIIMACSVQTPTKLSFSQLEAVWTELTAEWGRRVACCQLLEALVKPMPPSDSTSAVSAPVPMDKVDANLVQLAANYKPSTESTAFTPTVPPVSASKAPCAQSTDGSSAGTVSSATPASDSASVLATPEPAASLCSNSVEPQTAGLQQPAQPTLEEMLAAEIPDGTVPVTVTMPTVPETDKASKGKGKPKAAPAPPPKAAPPAKRTKKS